VTINGEQFVRARVDDSVTAERINARTRKKPSAEMALRGYHQNSSEGALEPWLRR